MSSDVKKNLGQYFTKRDLWLLPHIYRFIDRVNASVIMDPFAGGGDILSIFEDLDFNIVGFDIDDSLGWNINNSLESVPKITDSMVVTNPPYLAKNSAKKLHLNNYSYFDGNNFQDLYQIAILSVMNTYDYAVFIIPETFIRSEFFRPFIVSVTIIEEKLFEDTECPVCVACMSKHNDIFKFPEYDIFKNDLFLFTNIELNYRVLKYRSKIKTKLTFNDKAGNLGLRGVDGVDPTDRIRFCLPEELLYDLNNIKQSSRAITLINVAYDVSDKFIYELNDIFEDYRMRTHDILLAPFKNNNKIGKRRRRMDFDLARRMINFCISIS